MMNLSLSCLVTFLIKYTVVHDHGIFGKKGDKLPKKEEKATKKKKRYTKTPSRTQALTPRGLSEPQSGVLGVAKQGNCKQVHIPILTGKGGDNIKK